ncbi:YeeE/YedE thiosulfate transporter family protein [Rhodoplanes sp. TEM]|uniref:YeeE/YedE thiosulfate transporter family protein n=1 Tax=Rhodoplanes tepidamans TaxID=200616 RepID=A0ABT5JDG5_RHOTP|nr:MULTISPECIES: YeeE/YedE thiosulfate transporter family protein [Rhodoplanes]MDC7787553.1 YeeE/YedE thiosulfate transporter family protein [Rhodoplanes tepidamans]MDC7984954.1 YeeE/YedE thiosulfate transporter family protein [Rhodoplanes sp. TEM]MDQ0357982.1 putative membrane protein YedE/YeeE [Rhodoplanes tepidamans]
MSLTADTRLDAALTPTHPAASRAAAPPRPDAARRLQPLVVGAAGTALALGAAGLATVSGGRIAALWIVGALLGIALYHAAFGFTHGFRVLFAERRSAHVRAQLLLLGTAVLLFYPLLAAGGVLGQPVRGFVFPAGVEVALGAFLFGVGMQLGGGCASGTLYTAGGGSTRMLATLASFVAGATLAAFTYEHWHGLPSLPPIGAVQTLGLAPALAGTLAVLGLLWWIAARTERARHGGIEPIFGGGSAGHGRLWRGPWPFAWAALAIAALELATLLLAGRPWGITQAFALWGSHAVDRLGLDDPTFWAFWEAPTRADALLRPLAADITTVMDLGLIVGALLAAGLAGRFAPALRVPLPHLAAAVLGGLLLGFGAIMATGCNISAYVSGIASGSLHGWLWIAAALPGNWAGAKLRPLFRLGA